MENNQQHIIRFYDAIAHDYDVVFGHNDLGIHIRSLVQQTLLQSFLPGDHILELNCGTCTDAIVLGKHGIRVTAFDISPEMIDIAKGKIAREGLEQFVEARTLAIEDMDSLRGEKFQGAFSNFDGLNSFPVLTTVAETIAAHIKPGGRFLATLLNSWSVQKIWRHLFRLNFFEAFSRFSKRGKHPHKDFVYRIYYHSPFSVTRTFNQWFTVEKVMSYGVIAPPYNHHQIKGVLNNALPALVRWDTMLGGVIPFSLMGDHFTITLRRRHESPHNH